LNQTSSDFRQANVSLGDQTDLPLELEHLEEEQQKGRYENVMISPCFILRIIAEEPSVNQTFADLPQANVSLSDQTDLELEHLEEEQQKGRYDNVMILTRLIYVHIIAEEPSGSQAMNQTSAEELPEANRVIGESLTSDKQRATAPCNHFDDGAKPGRGRESQRDSSKRWFGSVVEVIAGERSIESVPCMVNTSCDNDEKIPLQTRWTRAREEITRHPPWHPFPLKKNTRRNLSSICQRTSMLLTAMSQASERPTYTVRRKQIFFYLDLLTHSILGVKRNSYLGLLKAAKMDNDDALPHRQTHKKMEGNNTSASFLNYARSFITTFYRPHN